MDEIVSQSERTQAGDRTPALERECRVFCRYLLGADPTAYVTERYVAAHEARPDLVARTQFDPVILRLAVSPVVPTRVCDAYARICAPRSLLRRKLSLLLAILESSPEVFRKVDTVAPVPRPVLVARLIGQLAIWLLALGVGAVLLLPLQALAKLFRVGRRDVSVETCQPPPRGGE